MQVRQAIIKPLATALGSFNFGGMFGMAHSGGVVGSDSLEHKTVNPNLFNNATKYHTGGIVGNEVPIIAKRGEAVFTPGQLQMLGKNNNDAKIIVNINNNASGVKAEAKASKDSRGNTQLDIMIEQIENFMVRNVAKGSGLAPIMERRYGLNPGFGSYL